MCIGYGIDGLNWLRQVSLGAQRVPVLAELVRDGLVQFWSVGERADFGGSWWSVTADEHEDAILEMLNRSRRNELLFRRPGLELQRVTVLERVSLYDAACEHRVHLREKLDAVRMLAGSCDAAASDGGGPKAFDYDWLALVDGTWSAGRPSAKLVERSAAIIAGLGVHRSFYVDHQSAARGVIPHAEAQKVFEDFALAILSSDLGFPRPQAGDEGKSQAMAQSASTGMATPVAVLTLVHRRDQFERQRATHLLHQLLRGPADDVLNLPETGRSEIPTLADALEAELQDVSNGVSGLKARQRRQAAIRGTVARYLAELAPTDGVVAVNRLRRVVESQRQQDAHRVAATTSAGFFIAAPEGNRQLWPVVFGALVILVAVFFIAAPAGNRSIWTAVFGALVMLAAAFWRYRRRGEADAPSELGTGASTANDETARERILKEWDRIADALDGFFGEFGTELAKWDSGASPAEQPWILDERPYHWKLGRAPTDTDRTRASGWLYEKLGTRVAECLLRCSIDGALLDRVLLDIAEKQLDEDMQGEGLQLERLLDASHNHAIQEAVRQMSPLANVVGGSRVQEIVWLAPLAATYGQLLVKTEHAHHQGAARILVSEDAGQSVRIVFGEDVPWRNIPSLGKIKTHTVTPQA